MKDLISVIIPVFNVERYLDRCVESVVNQTYQELEIWLINDGSTDNSGEICEVWAKKDNRIKVIHKKNGGLSDARNVGIENSTGEYLFFVDSDDYLELDIIESLHKSASENNAQIATSGFIYETDSEQTPFYAKENYVVDSKDILRRLFAGNDISSAIWDKLYLKDLFKKIEFPIGKIHEDTAILYQLFDKAEKISHINKAGYHYVQRQGSILYSKFKSEQLSIVEFKEEMVRFVTEKYPDLLEDAENFFIQQLNKSIVLCYKNGLKVEYQFWKNKLKQYIVRILRNSKMKLKTKLKSIIIICNSSRFLKK